MRLKLILRCENGCSCPWTVRRRIRQAAQAVLKEENITDACEFSVLLTDDEGIHVINREQRNIDQPTDVLSFPMGDINPENGRRMLGDMVLNLDRARSQGEEYGHGEIREISYLTVHSVLHLLGYDHVDEGPMKKEMRAREDKVMEMLKL